MIDSNFTEVRVFFPKRAEFTEYFGVAETAGIREMCVKGGSSGKSTPSTPVFRNPNYKEGREAGRQGARNAEMGQGSNTDNNESINKASNQGSEEASKKASKKESKKQYRKTSNTASNNQEINTARGQPRHHGIVKERADNINQ